MATASWVHLFSSSSHRRGSSVARNSPPICPHCLLLGLLGPACNCIFLLLSTKRRLKGWVVIHNKKKCWKIEVGCLPWQFKEVDIFCPYNIFPPFFCPATYFTCLLINRDVGHINEGKICTFVRYICLCFLAKSEFYPETRASGIKCHQHMSSLWFDTSRVV